MPLWCSKGIANLDESQVRIAVYDIVLLSALACKLELSEIHFSFASSKPFKRHKMPIVFFDLAEYDRVLITA